MRHIEVDFKKLTLPSNWTNESRRLVDALLAEPDPKKRSKIIDDNEGHWRLIKPVLAKLFNYKCWYTEAPQQGTDVDVDHYRPKKRVQETIKSPSVHDGYWWLAFTLSNYRYGCIVANRRRTDVETGNTGGKADHFPLLDEKNRARTPVCDLDVEQPVLLDPLKATDVQLLIFKEDGEAMPRYSEDKHFRKFYRADQSIVLYNINHSDFVRCRIDLRDEINNEIADAKRYFNKLEKGDSDNDLAYERAICRLRKMKSKDAPFSSFCTDYLETFRHKPEYDGVLDGIYI